MAALVGRCPQVHLTVNLTPVLLRQIEDYTERRYTDRALELTLKPTHELIADDRDYIATHFFDADWHNEIYPHARYKEIFEKRGRGQLLNESDITDLRMWFNLAWFASEFQQGDIELPDGSVASVTRFIRKMDRFNEQDIVEMVAEQFKIMRNIVLVHKKLQDAGQIEVSTTPVYHPILPLLHDTDLAILDREGTMLPRRFSFPEDADSQVVNAVAYYKKLFGRPPRGMWPAEGAVGESVIPYFKKHKIRWIASDRGVLKQSGKWGYEVDKPEVLYRAWRAGSDDPDHSVSIFFRDTELSDTIGFMYGKLDPQTAVTDFIHQLKQRFMPRVSEERIVSIILDGENAWGSYRQAGRPFFEALYQLLGSDPEICTVTFSEFIDGNADRGIPPHPLHEHPRVYELAHSSWIDEQGSHPGNDLGTWIGETEENAAWNLLLEAREAFRTSGVKPQTHAKAFEALYAAEGSDWFWWYGDDQYCETEPAFDDLFRHHLRCAYKLAGLTVPVELEEPLVPHVITWTFQDQVKSIRQTDRLRYKSGCPGVLVWGINDWSEVEEINLSPVGGVMAGKNIYCTTLRPLGDAVHSLELQFQCRCEPVCHCQPDDLCCNLRTYQVVVRRTGRKTKKNT